MEPAARQDDEILFQMMRRKLFSSVIGDSLDALGLLHQFLPPEIRPLIDDNVVVGRAMTVLHEDITGTDGDGRSHPTFGLMLRALDDLRHNEVYVSSGGSVSYALFGEHMATRARALGCVGAVVDGYSRDTHGIRKLNFPVFSRGRYGQDQRHRGRVVEFRIPIRIGEVRIAPGDIIFGDVDGVVVIPDQLKDEVLENAMDRVDREHKVREALKSNGMSATAIAEKFSLF